MQSTAVLSVLGVLGVFRWVAGRRVIGLDPGNQFLCLRLLCTERIIVLEAKHWGKVVVSPAGTMAETL